MQNNNQFDRTSELISIIRCFIDSSGFDVEFEKIANSPIIKELLDDNSILIRTIETTDYAKLLELKDSLELPLKQIKLASITSAFFSNHIQELNNYLSWDEKLFLKKPSPLEPIFLKTRFIEHLNSDPLILFYWRDFRGFLESEENDDDLDLYLKEINLGYDITNNVPIFHIFMDTFIKMGENEKGLIRPYIIEDDDNLILCQQNIKNLILGEWYSEDEESIYEVIWNGMKIVNEIYEKKYGFKIYCLEEEKPIFFRSIFYPTLNNYEKFLSDLAVMVVDNINKKELLDHLWIHIDCVKNTPVMQKQIKHGNKYFESKEQFNKYGSKILFISLLELNFNPHGTKIDNMLTTIWNERSKLHHSKSNKNVLDERYYDMQDSKLADIYRLLYSIINHEDPERDLCSELLEKYGLKTQFGNNGKIMDNIGFNRINHN